MNWLIICLVLLVFLFIINKFLHFTGFYPKIFTILFFLLLFFFVLSFIGIINSHSINMDTPSGFISAGKAYFFWFAQTFNNLKVITGNVVNMGWNVTS